jgi:hypothetical protein
VIRIVGPIRDVETIAEGNGIRERARLRKAYGGHLWRKKKGVARLELEDGSTRIAEIHWYETHGIGKREHKVKRYLD